MKYKIADIVKSNERLRKQNIKTKESGEESKYNLDYYHFVQYHVATYFDNDSCSLPQSEQKVGGKKMKSVSERLKGKTGRIRNNLMGKRVDFSARSVITPDPNLKITELGVPRQVAMELTFPEIVNPYNIKKLSELVKNARKVFNKGGY